MVALVKHLGINSVLDIGSGTGRAVLAVKHAGIGPIGIEPVQALRDHRQRKGLLPEELIDGDVQELTLLQLEGSEELQQGSWISRIRHSARHRCLYYKSSFPRESR